MTQEKTRTPETDETLNLGRQSTAEKSETITIRVAQLGRDVVEVTGPKDMTVSQALEKAGMSLAKGLDLRVNNSTCGLDRKLADGEIVMLVPRIVGGSVTLGAIAILDQNSKLVDVMWFDGN